MKGNNMEKQTNGNKKLKEFLDSIETTTESTEGNTILKEMREKLGVKNTKPTLESEFQEGKEYGWSEGFEAGIKHGRNEMYSLLKDLSTNDMRVFKEFVREAYKLGKASNA